MQPHELRVLCRYWILNLALTFWAFCLRIAEQPPGYKNILRAELNAILIAIKAIQNAQIDTHIH